MDALLNRKIAAALGRCSYIRNSSLRLDVCSGRVVLSGAVPSYFLKQMAQESLRSVEGVEEIQNELEVSNARSRRSRSEIGVETVA
ncbi:MAG: BON domain-containing protein [Thermoguttaceae bacterium]|nr:BON domain-containing protein [Thermoguttaceae bacterium]